MYLKLKKLVVKEKKKKKKKHNALNNMDHLKN